MSDNTVTIEFPDKWMAQLFIGWLIEQDAYAEFYDIAKNDTGMHTTIERPAGKGLACQVSITGRVVDDDDPEMYGNYEEDPE